MICDSLVPAAQLLIKWAKSETSLFTLAVYSHKMNTFPSNEKKCNEHLHRKEHILHLKRKQNGNDCSAQTMNSRTGPKVVQLQGEVLQTHGLENTRVRVRPTEPAVGDALVGWLRQVDAVPVDVCCRVPARARAGQPASRRQVVVVRPAAAAAHAEPRRRTEPCNNCSSIGRPRTRIRSRSKCNLIK